ncbi:uncharacterized protein [Chiloscyllium punctatum]|uniref:uncharacterized protein n=1 Tax=Chiloscyllium punctatum TaxID=137246 RepID=UPI003B634BB5
MASFFKDRNFPSDVVDDALHRISSSSHSSALEPCPSNRHQDRTPLVLTYHPTNLQIHRTILHHFCHLQTDPTTKDIFPSPSLSAFRKNHFLRNWEQRPSKSEPGRLFTAESGASWTEVRLERRAGREDHGTERLSWGSRSSSGAVTRTRYGWIVRSVVRALSPLVLSAEESAGQTLLSTELSLCTFWKKKREHISSCSTERTLDRKVILEASEAKSEACWPFTSWTSTPLTIAEIIFGNIPCIEGIRLLAHKDIIVA